MVWNFGVASFYENSNISVLIAASVAAYKFVLAEGRGSLLASCAAGFRCTEIVTFHKTMSSLLDCYTVSRPLFQLAK